MYYSGRCALSILSTAYVHEGLVSRESRYPNASLCKEPLQSAKTGTLLCPSVFPFLILPPNTSRCESFNQAEQLRVSCFHEVEMMLLTSPSRNLTLLAVSSSSLLLFDTSLALLRSLLLALASLASRFLYSNICCRLFSILA